MEQIRVVRVLIYEGTREGVARTLANSGVQLWGCHNGGTVKIASDTEATAVELLMGFCKVEDQVIVDRLREGAMRHLTDKPKPE